MGPEQTLRDKLKKIEALFAGAKTEGERTAAHAALERIKQRLEREQRKAGPIEMRFSIHDPWSRQLFLALARRYGLKPYRYPRQRRATVMLTAPKAFLEDVLWAEFKELNEALVTYLAELTERIIKESVFADTGEAEERPAPALIAGR